jgi:hypothetical protein
MGSRLELYSVFRYTAVSFALYRLEQFAFHAPGLPSGEYVHVALVLMTLFLYLQQLEFNSLPLPPTPDLPFAFSLSSDRTPILRPPPNEPLGSLPDEAGPTSGAIERRLILVLEPGATQNGRQEVWESPPSG